MRNKHILGLLFGAAAIAGFTSCNNEDFLDVTHYSMLESGAMFENDANAIKGMTGCYDLLLPRDDYNGDPYKYWIFNGNHPTMDSQASGWDKDFMTQNWKADNGELLNFWRQAYACASRCNDFLAGLEEAENISDDVKRHLRGEATALRGFEFFGLANTFGRVPLLLTGENYVNTPAKARAKDYEEMWDFVIKDFETASQDLDWKPFQNQYGRCTKGMALAFLGDAYMWKAYLVPDKKAECYQKAYDAFQEIIKSGEYELNPSYSSLYDADEAWPKEAIWQIVLNSGDQTGTWDSSLNGQARGWTGFYFGPTSNGAWGSYQMSWELYDSFELGDKRRDASMVTATIPYETIKALGKEKWLQSFTPSQNWLDANKKYLRGYVDDGTGNYVFNQAEYDKYAITEEGDNGIFDPQHPIGYNPFNQEFVGWCGFHWASSDPAPTVWSSKHWRNGRGTDWGTGWLWLPDHIYFKRYANVLLDMAECCFNLGKDSEGWDYINQIRQRAFGNTEVGKDLSKYLAHHQKVADFYGDLGHGDAVDISGYPVPFNTETVAVPDAQTYYNNLKATGYYGVPFTSEAWKVAVNQERRKEFSAEPYLRSDMHKSGFLEDHVAATYPKSTRPTNGKTTITEWRTARDFDFKIEKMFMPIPEDELLKNPLCDQNEGY